MEVDDEAGGDVQFDMEVMDLEMDLDVDSDESSFIETDMDVDDESEFFDWKLLSSLVGSAYSTFTVMSSPPSSSYQYFGEPGAIELDTEMEDVFEMAAGPLDNPPTHSALVPPVHQTYIEAAAPPCSPSPPAVPDPAQPSQSAAQVEPVDHYARAADPDFIEVQRQAASTALPESDDTDLGDAPSDDLEVVASIPLPGSDEEDIHLAEGASDQPLAAKPQAARQGDIVPEANIPLPPTVPGELDEPTTHGDMVLDWQDDDDTPAAGPQVASPGEDIPKTRSPLSLASPEEPAEPSASPDSEMAGEVEAG